MPRRRHETSSCAQKSLAQGLREHKRPIDDPLRESFESWLGQLIVALDYPSRPAPRRGFPLHRRFDVLVMAEQIRWIVFLLQLHQTLVVGTVEREGRHSRRYRCEHRWPLSWSIRSPRALRYPE